MYNPLVNPPMLLSVSRAIKTEKGKYWVQHLTMVARTLLAWHFLIVSRAIKTKMGKYWVRPCSHSITKTFSVSLQMMYHTNNMLLLYSRATKTEKGKHWVACLITVQITVMQKKKSTSNPLLKMNSLYFVLKVNLSHLKTYSHRVCHTVRIILILPTIIELRITYLGLQSGTWLMQTTNVTNLYLIRLHITNINLWILKIVPYNDLMIYTGQEVVWGNVPDIIQAHTLVRRSAMPNFMQVRIPVKSQLNVAAWKKYLHSYWDKQLIDLIQYDFPLDFNREVHLASTYVNHASATQHSQHVSAYIQTEMQYGAIYGPFAQSPFPCHVSPFLTRDKPDSDKRRVILDLSFPSGQSVNDGVPKNKYLGSYFDLKYPSVDHIVDSLKELGTGALLYKIDIKRAFRHLRIDPGDLDLLGLKHDQYYIDGNLPFGFRHGSVFFQRCSDAIRFIMADTFGYPNLYNYIDDLVYTGLPGVIHQSYHTLLALLQDLGLEISISKLIEPTHIAVCLGIEINSVNRTLQIPREKLTQIQQICQQYVSKKKVTKNQFQSLLGSLLYITKCVKPARFFLNRMLQLLRDSTDKTRINLNTEFFRDLNWFNTFLAQYNGITFYDNQIIHATVYLDACLQGLGGTFDNMVYALPLPLSFKNYSIVHLEILNLVVALKLWGPHWKDKTVEIKCDNMAVVEVLKSGRARDSILAMCARNIWLLSAMFNVELVVNHIPGCHNVVADLLSRWQGTMADNNTLNKLIPDHIWLPIHIDLTMLNEHI